MLDVLIIGGSNAGLSAALVLGRARRHILVLDHGQPRNAPSPHVLRADRTFECFAVFWPCNAPNALTPGPSPARGRGVASERRTRHGLNTCSVRP
jgi:choline dehydrogenase-like flavoprotein